VRLKEQAAELSGAQYAEQLAEAHAELADLPERLKAWGRASSLPAEIERLTQALAGLGAVNLAALDEARPDEQRKSYLDAQAQDPTEAMTTLKARSGRSIANPRAAAADLRCRQRQLRQALSDPLRRRPGAAVADRRGNPRFGVQVVAQPPGKRNTTIHLLSGGEKSLTAIALVFALFQLNPAPFCLLDEVDAPLDDPNTDRFCALVRTMADVTQFVFISHNKITMEMANQLIGITMADPGVSRVVAVDIAEALELAETVPQ
jgi:chromosome segregation protein